MEQPEFRGPDDPRKRCDLVITEVWQEKDRRKLRGMLTRYRLEDEDGNLVGMFFTPGNSRLSETLLKYARKKR